MKVKLERGKALVLVGPQGSGKTTLARQLAGGRKTLEIDGRALDKGLDNIGRVLGEGAEVVIIDGFPKLISTLAMLTGMITERSWICVKPGGEEVEKLTPLLVFCIRPDDLHEIPLDGRRFDIVVISDAGQ